MMELPKEGIGMQGCTWPPDPRKDRERESRSEPQWGARPAVTLTSAQ